MAAEFCVDTLGLHYPKELTYVWIVGVIIAADGTRIRFFKGARHSEEL